MSDLNAAKVRFLATKVMVGRKLRIGWNPFTGIADAFEMQAAIPEDKRPEYARQLASIWLQKTDDKSGTLPLFWVYATSEQRSEAALLAYGWEGQ